MAGQISAQKKTSFGRIVFALAGGLLGFVSYAKSAHAASAFAGGYGAALTHSQARDLYDVRAQGFYIDHRGNPDGVPKSERGFYQLGKRIYKNGSVHLILANFFGLNDHTRLIPSGAQSATVMRLTNRRVPARKPQIDHVVSDDEAALFEEKMTVPSTDSAWFWDTQALPHANLSQPATIKNHVKSVAPPAQDKHSELSKPGDVNVGQPASFTIIGPSSAGNSSTPGVGGPHASIDETTFIRVATLAVGGTAMLYLTAQYEPASGTLSYSGDQGLPKLLKTPAPAALADTDTDQQLPMSIQQAWSEARRVMLKRNKEQATDEDMNQALAQMNRSIFAHASKNPQTTFEATQYVLNKIVKQGFSIQSPGELFDVIARRDAVGNITDDFIAKISNEKARSRAGNYVMKMNKLAVLAA